MIDSFSVCYHGTIDVYSEKIMDNIDVSAVRFFTDFGQGFYVTSRRDQAEMWAINKFRDNVAHDKYVRPSIVKLFLDIDFLRQASGLTFDSPRTAPLVKQLIKGAISLQDFHSQVSPRRFEDQLSFNKLRALECITDMEVFTIEKLTPAG